jgi:hypothetical protein
MQQKAELDSRKWKWMTWEVWRPRTCICQWGPIQEPCNVGQPRHSQTTQPRSAEASRLERETGFPAGNLDREMSAFRTHNAKMLIIIQHGGSVARVSRCTDREAIRDRADLGRDSSPFLETMVRREIQAQPGPSQCLPRSRAELADKWQDEWRTNEWTNREKDGRND